jgi:cytochrome c peroxidase
MHDGRFKKLKDVLNYYGSKENHTTNQHPEMNKIGELSFEEKQNIILFLQTLTDKEFLTDRRFANPNFKG